MKKLMVLLIVTTMVFGFGMTVFADDTEVCELSPDLVERMLVIKEAFITEKLADGTLDVKTAAEMSEALSTQTALQPLRGLGFGLWLRDSEYAEEMLELMPHNNRGTRSGRGFRSENCSEDGEGYERAGRRHGNRL